MREQESYSSISLFLKCPYAYKLKYVDKKTTPFLKRFSRGRALHKALETFFNKGEPASNSLELKKTLASVEGLTPSDEDMLERYIRMRWSSFIFGDLIGTERYFKAEIEGIKLTGYIDLVYHDGEGIKVVDFKTSFSYRPDELQAFIYAEAIKQELGEYPEVYFHSIRDLTSIEYNSYNGELYTARLKMFEGLRAKGEFCPKPGNQCSWCFMKKHCEYAR